jgi:hypothetical protein
MSPTPLSPALEHKKSTLATSGSPKKKKKRAAPTFKVRFGIVSANEAAQAYATVSKRDNFQLSARRTASDIPIDKLKLTKSQREGIDALYECRKF